MSLIGNAFDPVGIVPSSDCAVELSMFWPQFSGGQCQCSAADLLSQSGFDGLDTGMADDTVISADNIEATIDAYMTKIVELGVDADALEATMRESISEVCAFI